MDEFRLLLRITHGIILLDDLDFEEKAVLCFLHALFKFLRSKILNKLIRILIGFHVDHLSGDPRPAQHRDCTHRRLDPGTVTVVG